MVLCLAMMLSIMVVGAGAAFADQSEIDTKHQEAVDACSTLNIITGFANGKFVPNDNVTREQTAKMICVLLNGGNEPVLGASVSSFSDVANDRWSCPYIESCVSQDIIVGIGGGKFAPTGKVTGSQLAKMLLVALGYSPDHQKYSGSAWEVNVNTDASARGFYVDLEDINPSEPLTREHAAQMIWNALNADEVEYKSVLSTENGQLTSKTTVTDRTDINNNKISLLQDKYGSSTEKAILNTVNFDDEDNVYRNAFVPTGTSRNHDSEIYSNTVDTEKDYSDLLGHQVKVMYKVDSKTKDVTILGIYATDRNKTVTALADDADDIANLDKGKTVEIDNKNYEISSAAKIVGPNGTTWARDIQKYFNITLVDNDKNNKYDYIIVEPFSVGEINNLTASKVTLSPVGNTDITANDKVKNSFDLNDDDVALYDGAAEDDYALVVDGKYTVSGDTEITKAEVVSGAVSSTKGSVSDVQVEGTWYQVPTTITGVAYNKINLNDKYDFVVANGFAFNAEKVKGSISADNILYIEKLGALSSGLADGVEAKVWFADSTSATIVKITGLTIAGNKTITYTPDGASSTATFNAAAGKDYDIVKTASASDEMPNAAAAVCLGDYMSWCKLFTFTEENGEYTVEPVYDGNMGSFDHVLNAGNITATAYVDDAKMVAAKDSTSVIARFADDAVIFVKDDDGVQVVKGSTVNKWKDTTVKGTGAGLVNDTNGAGYIEIGVLDLGNDLAKSDARTYGYITSDIASVKEGNTTYTTFTMWDGTNDVSVKVKNPAQAPVKYGFVAFDWKDEENNIAQDSGFTVKTAVNDAVSIVSVIGEKNITFSDQAKEWDFSDTHYIIGVDTNAGTGAAAPALKNSKDAPVGTYRNAVYFLDSTGKEVEAVFLDINNTMYTTKNGTELGAYGTLTLKAVLPENVSGTPVLNDSTYTITFVNGTAITAADVAACFDCVKTVTGPESGAGNYTVTGTASGTYTVAASVAAAS